MNPISGAMYSHLISILEPECLLLDVGGERLPSKVGCEWLPSNLDGVTSWQLTLRGCLHNPLLPSKKASENVSRWEPCCTMWLILSERHRKKWANVGVERRLV